MANFSYRALSQAGKPVDGSITADRIELASRELRAQGLTLLRLEPESATGREIGGGKGRADASDVLALTRELAVLLRAGLPIDRALKVMIDMAANERLRELMDDLLGSVKSGKGFSQALLAYPREFSTFYVNMVRSGEASGRLDEVLARLSEYLTNAKTVRASVVSALIYPAILLVVAVLSIIAMLGFVVPQFETLFNDMGDALPVLTRGVIAAGDFIARYGWLLLVIMLLAAYLVRGWFRSPEGRAIFDERLLNVPLFGSLVFKYEVAKFART
ncbi:MAG: type II secretion system F family protein, partial [Halioglobus sp.]|nr:type II secretion system F family protein [Halioglobus sp.]